MARLRRGMDRLIDSYAEEVIDADEFKPRLAGLKQRLTRLRAERDAALAAHEAGRSLQLMIGRLEEFAGRVRAGLDGLDWHGRREIIRALVRRIEIDREQVEVVFRIPGAPPPADGGALPRSDPSQTAWQLAPRSATSWEGLIDEFFGNLYHLNAEEEPENPDYPKDPAFRAKFGPRGVLKCKASDRDDPTEDPRFGRVGRQTIEDTGPLTRKRMETVDEEFLGATLDFIDRQHRANTPFFCWFNATRMHIYTHLKPESKGKTGLGIVADGMTEFDGMVGQLLKKLDDLGIAENTIVVWTTDNGAEVFSWPDGGTTPFKGEKNTNWEGGYRVPCAMRWPGVIKPGTEINHITSHEDFVPTLVAAAGEPNVKEKLLSGYQAAGKTFKVHLDGYDQRDVLAGTGPGKRQEYFYWTDDGNLAGLRYDRWKLVFLEQRAEGLDVWQDPLITAALPEADRHPRRPLRAGADDAGEYARWRVEHAFALVPAQAYVPST